MRAVTLFWASLHLMLIGCTTTPTYYEFASPVVEKHETLVATGYIPTLDDVPD